MKYFSNAEHETLLQYSGTSAAHGGSGGALWSSQTYRSFGKRNLDILILITAVWLALPIIAICAAITALDGGSPFFGHKRVGRGGREFRCWKIRSMISDSQARLSEHLAADPVARQEWENSRKLKNDPRITRFGRFLRKTSLDELPQLLNVLRA